MYEASSPLYIRFFSIQFSVSRKAHSNISMAAILINLARGFIFPISSLLYRIVESNRTGAGTIIDTASAVPTFIWVQDDWRFTFFPIWYVYIYLADFYTMIAAVADFRVKNHRGVGSGNIR
jgi:hypothetical protein